MGRTVRCQGCLQREGLQDTGPQSWHKFQDTRGLLGQSKDGCDLQGWECDVGAEVQLCLGLPLLRRDWRDTGPQEPELGDLRACRRWCNLCRQRQEGQELLPRTPVALCEQQLHPKDMPQDVWTVRESVQ